MCMDTVEQVRSRRSSEDTPVSARRTQEPGRPRTQDPGPRIQDTDSQWYCTCGCGRVYGLSDSVRRQASSARLDDVKSQTEGGQGP